jgi:hypothetical protein
MNRQIYPSGKPSGSLYEKQKTNTNDYNGIRNSINTSEGIEDDLIIEENTVYEIDRECFERLKRKRNKR